jgi:hypothetical protein
MLRRNARLRREYLYRKSLEGKERAVYERKRKIREALAGMSMFYLILPPAQSHLYVLSSMSMSCHFSDAI